MKNHLLPILLLTLFLLSATGAAQNQASIIYITEQGEIDAHSTQIAVKIPADSPITKIRLNNENDGKSLIRDVSAVKSFMMPVELAEGENSFNIIGYENNKIVYSTETPIVITRKKSSSAATPATGTPQMPLINQFSATAGAAATGGTQSANSKRLRLRGKGEIKNQAAYNLEIDASELSPIAGNYAIEIETTNAGKKNLDSETRKIEHDPGINRHKQLQSVELNLREGTNIIRVAPRVEGHDGFAQITVECKNCKDQPAPSESVIVRSIVGLEQVGASSARSEQRPFLSLFFNTPINAGTKMVCPKELINKGTKTCRDDQKIEKSKFTFSVWGDIRLTTTPVQSIGSLASFTPAVFASNFVQGDSAGKVNDLVRSFDFLVGFDKEIFAPSEVFPSIFPGKTSLSFIAAGGAISPLSSDKGALFYKIPMVNNGTEIDRTFLEAFPEAAGKKNVAFVAPERDRFFRQYYAGFRLKTFFSDKETRYLPAMFDVTFGQNEAITDRLKGVIMRLDGSTPFPVSKAGFLYLFGSVNMRLGRSSAAIPSFFLEPATNVTLTNAETVVLPIDRSPFQTKDRDVFRIGVGVDVFKLFKKDEAPK